MWHESISVRCRYVSVRVLGQLYIPPYNYVYMHVYHSIIRSIQCQTSSGNCESSRFKRYFVILHTTSCYTRMYITAFELARTGYFITFLENENGITLYTCKSIGWYDTIINSSYSLQRSSLYPITGIILGSCY